MTALLRPGTRSDRTAVGRVLGRAFTDDPIYRWLLPDAAARERHLAGLMRSFLTLPGRGADVELAERDGALVGVAFWDRPGHVAARRRDTARALPAMWRATGAALPRLAHLGEVLEAARPAEPHHYLFHLAAAEPGQGVGSALLRSGDRRPAYLECKPALVPYYARFGFAERGEVVVEPGALSVMTMWRGGS